jgi:hypothetical protein
MNIFVLSEDPIEAARAHLDKHVVKMIVEYAQLLSTAHRLLDGEKYALQSEERYAAGKKPKFVYSLPGENAVLVDGKIQIRNQRCYNVTHQNHPSAVWTRESKENYSWLSELFKATAAEYTHRYGRIHNTWAKHGKFLMTTPKKIPNAARTPFALAMPDEFKDENAVQAYRNYYLGPKATFAKWTNRPAPAWFKDTYKDYNASDFERPARAR